MPHRSDVVIPVAYVLFGILLLDLMAVIIRILSDSYPTAQLAALRNLFGMVPSLVLLYASAEWTAGGRRFAIRQWPLGFLRGVLVTAAQMCFYIALLHLDFATVGTLVYASPLIVTALSVPLLGERVGIWRWTAVVIGFAGIVLIMRPGTDAFTLAALLPLGAAAGYASSSVLVRRIDTDVPSPLVNLYATFAAMVCASLIMLATATPVWFASWQDALLIFVMGCSGGTGVLFLIFGYRRATPSVIAPFEYTGILIAFALGWFFFGEAPIDTLFPGVLLIVGAGLLIVWRERRVKGKVEGPPVRTRR
ncbi:MAG: DMT family transporter [Pseudomonadota bacterium]